MMTILLTSSAGEVLTARVTGMAGGHHFARRGKYGEYQP